MVEKPTENEQSPDDISRRAFAATFLSFLAVGADKAEAQQKVPDNWDGTLLAPVDPIKIGDGTFTFIATMHHSHTLKMRMEAIENYIAKAPFVMVEYFHPSMNGIIRHINQTHGQIPAARSDPDEVHIFFAGVAQLAAKHGKDIVVVNPQTLGTDISSKIMSFDYTLAEMSPYTEIATAGFGAMAAAKLNRRQLWKAAAYLAPATMAARGIVLDKEMKSSIERIGHIMELYGGNPKQLTKEDARYLAYQWPNIQKWRDEASATGTRKAFEVFKNEVKDKVVPGFYGAAHTGMVESIEDPPLIGEKAYPYLNLFGNRTIRRWRYSQRTKSFLPLGDPIKY